MQHTSHFTTRFLLPIVIAVVLTIGVAAGFLAWSAQRIDHEAEARDLQLLQRGIEDLKSEMFVALDDFVTRDEAVDAVESGDMEWLVEGIGVYAFDIYSHSRVFVLDKKFRPIMAVRDGGEVSASSFAEELAKLRSHFEGLRSVAAKAGISAYNYGVQATPPHVLEYVLFEQQAALMGVMPVLSYSGDNAPPVGTEALVVSMLLLNEELATRLGDRYRIASPAFVYALPGEEMGSLPIIGAGGEPIAWLVWQPESPGARVIEAATPALAAALLAALVIVGLLLANLRSALMQLHNEREDARHRALHDPLTGLANRSLFNIRLSEGLRAMPKGEPRLALLALDLDRFKQVNDTLGHQAGDELLIKVAERLKPLLRPEDTLGRLGGDEFCVIMPNIASADEPQALARAIITALTQAIPLAAGTASIGVSIGISTAPDQAMAEADLVRCADEALYSAKNGGRNRICVYRENAQTEPARRDSQLRESFSQRSYSA